MSEKHIRWTKRALRRLDEIGAHIQKDNPDAAARVVARIVSAVNMLADFPAWGRVGRINGTRELVLAGVPYIIPRRARYRNSHDHACSSEVAFRALGLN